MGVKRARASDIVRLIREVVENDTVSSARADVASDAADKMREAGCHSTMKTTL